MTTDLFTSGVIADGTKEREEERIRVPPEVHIPPPVIRTRHHDNKHYDYDDADDNYEYKDNDDNEEYVHDQLPSVEEVRMRAASVLNLADRVHQSRMQMIQEHIPLNTCKLVFFLGILLMIVAISSMIVGIALQSKSDNDNNTKLDRSQVESFLLKYGIALTEELNNSQSPQFKAISWLVESDGNGREELPSSDDNNIMYFLQRYVLVVMYYTTHGNEWESLRNIMRFDLITCDWNTPMKDVNGNVFDMGASCNYLGVVDRIQLPWTNLNGTLPREIGYLTELKFLALNYNYLGGSIPPEYQLLTKLDYMALQQNEITGTIPTWIDQLSGLEVLGLGSNHLTGTLPSAMRRLTNLVTLGLDENEFEGDLEHLQYLTKMKRLYLDLNNFKGPLLANPVLKMRELQELDLSDNVFTGSIPLDFFQFSNLEVLDLNSNFLTGSLPLGSYATSTSLKFLNVQFNQLTGTIHDEILSLQNLAHLDLSLNDLSGTIPMFLGKMTNLKYLFLADNPFEASTIPNLSMLTNLEDLSLKKTNLTNEIPAFTKLKKLVLLDLDNNNLSGEIPIELSELTNLKFLYLSRNEKLIGPVPTEIQLLPKLKRLLLSSTSLTGNLGPLCSRSYKVSQVEVSSADCHGNNPEIVCTCCTICCADNTTSDNNTGDQACRDTIYFEEYDPSWKYDFLRQDYNSLPVSSEDDD